ncbi:MAG TPA: RimK family alpha-L-glutamate ligase [Jatrophihabitans sp.]|jgi:[lysine-biosynthesis-protein LysW]--L-2-aminoadipate ligase|uniref:RimK family alpha-L-glutamate ligase n=1 Tax=Jatrophihabitans sp. TaxID=1932789 RepID=UPI002F183CD0
MRTASAQAPVAVLASRVRSDEKRLFAALTRRGVPYVQLDTRELRMPDTPVGAPVYRAVLNREISLSRAVYAARSLEIQELPMVNSAHAIEICGDKWRTSLQLRRHGVATPDSCLALSPQAALAAMLELGFPLVVKPLTGSWGRLVTPVRDLATAEIVLDYIAALPGPQAHLVYLQRLVAKPDRDLRVIVIGDQAVGAIYRRSDQWRTNVALGGQPMACPLTEEMAQLARAAARAVGAAVAGVDLIEGADGQLTVLEVNAGVEFGGFQQAHGDSLELAELIVDHLLAISDEPVLAGARS